MPLRLSALALVLALSACAGTSGLPSPNEWFVVPPSEAPVTTYLAASGLQPESNLAPSERYQIVGKRKQFYRVRTAAGREAYITATKKPILYQPAIHGTTQALDRQLTEYRTCASFATSAEAQQALAAGNSRLDADGDGEACEQLGRARASTRTAAPSRGSRSNCHTVAGHWRKTKKGRTWVKAHTRCR